MQSMTKTVLRKQYCRSLCINDSQKLFSVTLSTDNFPHCLLSTDVEFVLC